MAHVAAIAATVNGTMKSLTASTPSLVAQKPLAVAKEGAGKLLKADDIAAPFRSDIQSSIASSPIKPRIKLVGILAGGALANKPSEVYAEFTKKQCETMGVEYVLRKVDEVDGQGAIEDAIIEANRDESVQGIMVRHFTFLHSDMIMFGLHAERIFYTAGVLSYLWWIARSLSAAGIPDAL